MAEQTKPGFGDWLVRHNVTVVFDETLAEKGAYGYASCDKEGGVIGVYPERRDSDVIKTMMHEFAHCKEQVAREEKELPRGFGKWKKIDRKLVPVGSEERAEKFASRMRPKIFEVI